MSFEPIGLSCTDIDDLPAVEVGPGCRRRDLPTRSGVRAWIVDIDPGAAWPMRDHHDHHGEDLLVVSGELIEGDQRLGPGTYLNFAPGSSHRPRSQRGVRLFGFNLTQ